MKTAIVIPAYNASKTIGKIVKKCLAVNSIITVIDNNSTDATAYNALNNGAIVFKEYVQGQGAATRRGWLEAIKAGYDTVITLDSDGQHNPEEIPILLEALVNADIAIGCRFHNKAYSPDKLGFYACYAEELQYSHDIPPPKYRMVGILIITWLYNVLHKSKLMDSQCCFRAYNNRALSNLKIEENGFGFSTELLIKARKLGLRMVEVPVSCIYHSNRKMNSTLNPIKHGLIVAWKTIYWRIRLWN